MSLAEEEASWSKLSKEVGPDGQSPKGQPLDAAAAPSSTPRRKKKKWLVALGVALACAVVGTAVSLGVYYGGEMPIERRG